MTQPPANYSKDPRSSLLPIAIEDIPSEREPLRHLLIGSPRGVTSTIHNLYGLGYAEVGIWSPLLLTPNSREVMFILTRYILL